MAFLAANLVVAATAVRVATIAPLRGGLDRVLVAAVAGTGQIVVSLLIAGGLLQALKPGAVLLTNVAIAIAVFGLTIRLEPQVRLRSWRLPAADLWKGALRHRWVALVVVTAALALLWRVLIAYAFPPYGYDTLAYHLPTVAGWLQYGHIDTHHLHIYSASFPANMELLFTWVALFLHSDVWIGTVQIPLAVVAAIAVAGMARVAGVGSPAAIAAGALFILTPVVLTQSSSNYVDLGVASLFLAGIYLILRAFPPSAWGSETDRDRPPVASTWSRSSLAFAGCAIGLAAGAKNIGPLLGLVALLCLLTGVAVSRRRLGRAAAGRPLILALLLLLPMLCFSSFWYIRDWVEFSNPLYPANVHVLGITVFHGLVSGLPSRLPTGSGLTAIVHSWGYDLTRLFNHSSGKWDRADEYEGGLGLIWLVLGLPLLIPLAIASWKRNQMLFWTFLIPLGVLFAIQPYRWWSRFTIFLLAPALVGVAHFMTRPGSRRSRIAVQSVAIGCVATSLWLSSSHVVGWKHVYGVGKIVATALKPTQQRTLGRLFLPELRWVDDVAPRARIAAYFRINIAKDEFPPFYGLYGRRFRHSVFALPRGTRAATLSWLDAHAIGYVYLRRPSPQEAWLHSDGRFRLLFANARVAAYATRP